jgi:ParB family transcriptional regulator, chromosome partitioning protein
MITGQSSVQQIEFISIASIMPSQNPIQERRRKRFDKAKLAELSESIKKHGVVQPITVRALASNGFEIVAGERRWLASLMAEQLTVPAIIKDLNDQDAFEIQLLENLEREDLHPVDECDAYVFLSETYNLNVPELALRVGRTENYVANRLKLTDLIPEVLKDFEEGFLPFGNALEIAKYPAEIQASILEKAYKGSCWNSDRTDGSKTLAELKKVISEQILLQLADAPFSTISRTLHPQNLACTNCPQRTGANATLFGEVPGGDDRCLNRECYDRKVVAHVREMQTMKSLGAASRNGDVDFRIPLIYWNNITEKQAEYSDALTSSEYRMLWDRQTACKTAEPAILLDGHRKHETVYICRDTNCETHSHNSVSGSAAEDDSEKKAIRKEELFDIRVVEGSRMQGVGQGVRVRVLLEASRKYNLGQLYEDAIVTDVILRLWKLEDSSRREILKKMLNEEFEISLTYHSQEELPEVFENLDRKKISQIFFLVMNFYKGEILWDSYKSQQEIREIAAYFSIDYKLIDAQERLALAEAKYKKFVPEFKTYLSEIEAGKDAKIPRPFSDKWNPEAEEFEEEEDELGED